MNPPVMDQARSAQLGNIGAIANTPLARYGIRYWWITAPLAFAMWTKYKERKKSGTASLSNLLADAMPYISIVGTLVIVNETLQQRDERRAANGAAPVTGPIKDASFTVKSSPAPTGAAHVLATT